MDFEYLKSLNKEDRKAYLTEQTEQSRTELEAELTEGYKLVVDALRKHCALNDQELNNLNDHVRIARGVMDIFSVKPEILRELDSLFRNEFPISNEVSEGLKDYEAQFHDAHNGFLIQTGIAATSMCPHHLLPVMYKVTVAYKLGMADHVLGLSKLSRLVKTLAKRPLVQEQYTKDIVTALVNREIAGLALPHKPLDGVPLTSLIDGIGKLVVEGGGAITTGSHACMQCRGVNTEAKTTFIYQIGLSEADYTKLENAHNQMLTTGAVRIA